MAGPTEDEGDDAADTSVFAELDPVLQAAIRQQRAGRHGDDVEIVEEQGSVQLEFIAQNDARPSYRRDHQMVSTANLRLQRRTQADR